MISTELFNLGKNTATGKWILNPATLAAIKTFREDFAACQPKIIDKGTHFRWETLQELADAYAEAAVQWRYDFKQCSLLEDAVLSWVLNYVPENGVQEIYYLGREEPFKRRQKTHDGKDFYETLKQQSIHFQIDGSCNDVIGGHISLFTMLLIYWE